MEKTDYKSHRIYCIPAVSLALSSLACSSPESIREELPSSLADDKTTCYSLFADNWFTFATNPRMTSYDQAYRITYQPLTHTNENLHIQRTFWCVKNFCQPLNGVAAITASLDQQVVAFQNKNISQYTTSRYIKAQTRTACCINNKTCILNQLIHTVIDNVHNVTGDAVMPCFDVADEASQRPRPTTKTVENGTSTSQSAATAPRKKRLNTLQILWKMISVLHNVLY